MRQTDRRTDRQTKIRNAHSTLCSLIQQRVMYDYSAIKLPLRHNVILKPRNNRRSSCAYWCTVHIPAGVQVQSIWEIFLSQLQNTISDLGCVRHLPTTTFYLNFNQDGASGHFPMSGHLRGLWNSLPWPSEHTWHYVNFQETFKDILM